MDSSPECGHPRVLWMMPLWNAPSEAWAARMLELLRGRVVAIAVEIAPDRAWLDGVPIASLCSRYVVPVARRFGVESPVDASLREHQLDALFRRARPDVVLVHYLTYALMHERFLARCGAPVFVHCHGYDVTFDLRHPDAPSKRYHPADYQERVLALSRWATLIANSAFTARLLRAAGVAAERIVVKPLSAPIPAEPPVHPPTSCPQLLYLGRLVDFKGPDLVLQAFLGACDRGLDARLVMAGDGPLRATCELLRARSRHQDRVQLLGAVSAEQGARLRRQSDIFVAHNCQGPITGQVECFGVTIVEAMADGLPVLTARSGAVEETVVHNETGILVEPHDVRQQQEALLSLATDGQLRHRLGLAGWRRAMARYAPEVERQRLLEILTSRTC
jgi:colanic acid/amylovoran biosynthesis glycosyltransferase